MADLNIAPFVIVGLAAPVLVFSGRGIVDFFGDTTNVRVGGASGSTNLTTVPAGVFLAGQWVFYEDTDVYAVALSAGNFDFVVMSRPLPRVATLAIDCGA